MITLISGNILDFDGFIAHQCNVTSQGSAGLAREIFKAYPLANTYGTVNVSNLGNVHIIGNVINMYAQRYPSYPSPNSDDSPTNRLTWFRQCLEKIDKSTIGTGAIAFPWGIGCGLAGGDWNLYSQALLDFSDANPYLTVYIVKLPN